MKMRNKYRGYKDIPKRYFFLGPMYDMGPKVETENDLPPKGHRGYIYIVGKELNLKWYVWDKQRGHFKQIDRACVRVRPQSRSFVKEDLVVQPLYKHVPSLPIMASINAEGIEL